MVTVTASSRPTLYSFRRCPYAMRARLAIAISGLGCELREVVLRDKPDAMLQASPKGTVPVLIDIDGTVVDQSLDIMLWALGQSDPEGWLTPQQGDLPAMLNLIAQCDGPFKDKLDRYKYPQRYGVQSGADQRDQTVPWLLELEQRLQAGTWLCGKKRSLADMAIVPFVRQFAHTDIAWFDAQPWPSLRRWLADWQASALFARIMHKYPAWQEGDPPVLFPPAA
ncbi:glutathione S-transferase [Alcaligenaceae bacterium]|nr:glutathione S-transferase [Alcaligenaceae bacterium]